MDTTKKLFGPHDLSIFGGPNIRNLRHSADGLESEKYSPFHFRTFRVLSIDIEVATDSDLIFQGIDITKNQLSPGSSGALRGSR